MSGLARRLMAGVGAAEKLYVDDVFSTWLYAGNGSSQTITNGIDLAGKGGLVWTKPRTSATYMDHSLYDTVRGVSKFLRTNGTDSQLNFPSNGVTAFSSSGFTVADSGNYAINANTVNYASWAFRKAPKFFDVVTWTGDGDVNRLIPHNLGVTPGMIIIKATSTTGSWVVYHIDGVAFRYFTAVNSAGLNSTAAQTGQYSSWGGTNSSTFYPAWASNDVYANGVQYVAYLFAHDASVDGIIQCGSFTTDGSGNAAVNLGWEPQYLLFKQSDGATNWIIEDSMRSMAVGNQYILSPNTSTAEGTTNNLAAPTATGFKTSNAGIASRTYIYLAIRRPNKPPTTGTEVYKAIARTGTGTATTVTGVGFAPDLVLSKIRNASSVGTGLFDKLRGPKQILLSYLTIAEYGTTDTVLSLDMDGASLGVDGSQAVINSSGGYNYINHFFRRASGFMDVVCYTGTSSVGNTQSHNLQVFPELIITKARSGVSNWTVVSSVDGAFGNYQSLNLQTASATFGSSYSVSAATFTPFNGSQNNTSGVTYISYLFASLPGISKVGSYTGNGGTQTIPCGFSTGARFVLIKRTDSTGDWLVADTTRGLVSGGDPRLSLNTTAAEVTGEDWIDPAASGFIINQTAADANANGATYIFLSVA